MATEYKLEVQKRDEYGKKASKNLRRNGVIPGIYYSPSSENSFGFANSMLSTSKVGKPSLFLLVSLFVSLSSRLWR